MRKFTRATSIVLAFCLALVVGSAVAESGKSSYVIKGSQVYDKKTRLTWQRCSVGQSWRGPSKGCVGAVTLFSFDDAQKAGHGSWRVPSKDELGSLVDLAKIANHEPPPLIDTAAFPNMDPENLVYWSSTSDEALFAWCILFRESETYIYSGPRKKTYAVRLVRGGK